ncbi:amidase [Blastococcus sp. SYSU D00820]
MSRPARDAVATAVAFRTGELTPAHVLEETLAAIDRVDPVLNAFTVVDADGARAQARAAAERIAAGDPSPLLGIPVTVKDAIWAAGLPATNGSRAYASFVPERDATVVARLRAAGAVVVGKTNNPEFLYRTFTDNLLFGPTRNPWDPSRTAGGSSGGSAAALAAGLGLLSLGSDSGGSVRVPASFCGVVGLKPTLGVVPGAPGFRGCPSLSSVGPMARTVRDTAVLLDVIAGIDPEDPGSVPWAGSPRLTGTDLAGADLTRLRIAYSVDLGQAVVDPEVERVFRAAVTRLADLGCRVEERHVAGPELVPLWGAIAGPECFASEGPLLDRWRAELAPGTEALVEAGRAVSAAEYLDAQHRRALLQRDWEAFLSAEADVLLTPVAEVPAYPVDEGPPATIGGRPCGDPDAEEWTRLALLPNLTRQPALAVPVGHTAGGLPVGMQIVARRFRDDLCLRVGAAWEALTGFPAEVPGIRGR